MKKPFCKLNDESLLTVLLFGSKIYNEQVNVQILNASIDFYIIYTHTLSIQIDLLIL